MAMAGLDSSDSSEAPGRSNVDDMHDSSSMADHDVDISI